MVCGYLKGTKLLCCLFENHTQSCTVIWRMIHANIGIFIECDVDYDINEDTEACVEQLIFHFRVCCSQFKPVFHL